MAEPREQEVVSQALKAEEKLKSYWYILTPEGEMTPISAEGDKISGFNFDSPKFVNLGKLTKYEMAKSRVYHQTPPHIPLMRRLELADFEPGSDPGNLRWYPPGRLVKSLLEQYVTQKVVDYGGMEIESPLMYDFKHPSLVKYLNRFPARQYVVKSDDKEYFLRFAACFGQFLMLHDAQISHKQLPLKLYELTRYSFRREKSGELAGLKRLRAFTMSDCHALCADLEQAKGEMEKRFDLSRAVLDGVGIDTGDYEMAIRFTKDFFEQNREFVFSLVKRFGRPVLAEMWEEKFFYFVLKWEFNFVDCLDKASTLSTDQIDVENGERFGITYVAPSGEKKHPIILHCSPSGAIERIVYALLEKMHKQSTEGKRPSFPLWLAPTQVRILSISEKFVEPALALAAHLEKHNIRVDVDDTEESIPKKVRNAETDWIPYTIVFGQREMESPKLPIRSRETGKVESLDIEEFAEKIRSAREGKPFRTINTPKLLSKRPIFVG